MYSSFKRHSTLLVICLSIAVSACSPNKQQSTHSQHHTSYTSTDNNSANGSSVAHYQTHDLTTPHTANQPAYILEYQHSMTVMNQQMVKASQLSNPDLAFVKGMIAHHQGAIAMAKIELKYGKNTQMRALAQKIIEAQQDEIIVMNEWLNQHKALEQHPTTHDLKNHMHNHDTTMMQALNQHDADRVFAQAMIPHHQGAIEMAEVELKTGHDSQLQKLAQDIIVAQTPEIEQMQAWLESNT